MNRHSVQALQTLRAFGFTLIEYKDGRHCTVRNAARVAEGQTIFLNYGTTRPGAFTVRNGQLMLQRYAHPAFARWWRSYHRLAKLALDFPS
jgi:hypothetical protein